VLGRLLAIALGGAIGSMARYLISGWVQRSPLLLRWGMFGPTLPWGTFVVNLTGCLLMGFLAGLFQERLVVHPELRALVLIGILGGYTTFSSFALETLRLVQQGSFPQAALNGLAGPALCLLGVWAGDALSGVF
jgi:fluoride exporter